MGIELEGEIWEADENAGTDKQCFDSVELEMEEMSLLMEAESVGRGRTNESSHEKIL